MGKNGGGGSVTLDTVMIKIETESGKAASNIGNLAKNLENLKNSIKGARYSNLNKLSEALERLVPSLQKLGSTSNISESIANITNGLSQLKSVASPTGFAKAVNSLEKFPEVINKIDTKTFENLKRVSEELSKSLEPLADKMDKVAQGYSAFSKIQNTFGKSATTVTRYAKQEKSIFGELSKTISRGSKSVVQFASGLANAFGKKSINNLKSFHSKFKQVYLSLLGTRTLFTMIRKAASEYMNFDQTLQKFSTNVWRAFGAQLAPALEYAMYLFKQFVRVIYSVIYALTGIDLIARANAKAMQGWSKAAKDTLGNLQKFDDLNVVEFPKGKGDDELIEMDKIDLSPIQKVIDWVKKLKEEIQAALDTGEWYNVGKVFAQGITDGIQYLNNNMGVIKNNLINIAIDVADTLNGVIENIGWDDIGTFISESFVVLPDAISSFLKRISWDELGKGLNSFFSTFDAGGIVHSVMEVFKNALVGFGELIAELDWSIIGPKIGEAIVTFFKDLSTIINSIPWSQIGEAVRGAIENINWGDVWSGIVSTLKEVLEGVNDFVSAITGIDTSTLEAIEIVLTGIGSAFVTYKLVKNFAKLAGFLGTVAKVFGATSFITSVGVIAGLAAGVIGLVKAFQGLLDMFKNPSWKAFWDILTGISIVVGGVALAMGGWVAAIVAGVVALVGMVASYLAEHWDFVKEWWNGVVSSIGEWFSNLGASIAEWWNGIIKGAADFLNSVQKNIEEWWSGIQSWWSGVKEWWGQKFDEFAKWVDEKLVQPVLQFIENMKTGIAEKMGDIKGVFGDVKTWIGEKVNNIKEAIKPVADWIYNKLIKPVQDKFNGMKNKFSDIWDSIKTKWNNLWEDGLWGGSKKIINKMLGGAESFVNGIVGGINGLSSGIRKVGNKIFDIIGVDITFDPISKVSIPKLATGTNEIPNEGLYHLHPGEAVVPKKYNPALGNGGNDEMVAKMDTLIDIMNNMSFTNVVNIGNKKIYEGQQAFNKTQQNKYGTIDLY